MVGWNVHSAQWCKILITKICILHSRGKYAVVAEYLKRFWANYNFSYLWFCYTISWPQVRLNSCQLIFVFCTPDNWRPSILSRVIFPGFVRSHIPKSWCRVNFRCIWCVLQMFNDYLLYFSKEYNEESCWAKLYPFLVTLNVNIYLACTGSCVTF